MCNNYNIGHYARLYKIKKLKIRERIDVLW